MSSPPEKSPIVRPSPRKTLDAATILYGAPISPIKRLRVMDNNDYEDFIGEWLWDCVRDKYTQIHHLGGAGDLGRDFAAAVTEDSTIWDNYQCKHYKNPLSPADIIKEVGKLAYHCFNKRYSWPRKYYFIAPDISPKSHDLLNNTKEMKALLLEKWNSYSKYFSTSESTKLSTSIQDFIDNADFSIFSCLTGEEIISQFRQSPSYASIFGNGLQPRPKIKPEISAEIREHEQIYTKKLFEAYSSDENKSISCANDLNSYPNLMNHFNRQREHYYQAEMLKEFSRENLPPESEAFEDFKEDIYHGIIPAVEEEYNSCKTRLNKTLLAASRTPIEANALRDKIRPQDKQGVCHHLANEKDDIRWTSE